MKPLNLRPHSREEGSNNGLGAVKEGGGGTFPALNCHRARGPREEEEGRVASVTMPIWHPNHDLYSRLISWQPCAERKSGYVPLRLGHGQKKAPLEGRAGPRYKRQASCKEGTSSAPKGRRKDAQCPAHR